MFQTTLRNSYFCDYNLQNKDQITHFSNRVENFTNLYIAHDISLALQRFFQALFCTPQHVFLFILQCLCLCNLCASNVLILTLLPMTLPNQHLQIHPPVRNERDLVLAGAVITRLISPTPVHHTSGAKALHLEQLYPVVKSRIPEPTRSAYSLLLPN